MNNCIELKRITTKDDPALDEANLVYEEAFPEGEKRPWREHIAMAINNKSYYLFAAFDGDNLIGILIYWDLQDFIFGDYLAIKPSAREKKYGERIIRTLTNQISKPVIVEVERPEDELSTRRIGFYQRLGFHLSDYPYFMPDFSGNHENIPMLLMSYPDPIDHKFATLVTNNIHTKVYR